MFSTAYKSTFELLCNCLQLIMLAEPSKIPFDLKSTEHPERPANFVQAVGFTFQLFSLSEGKVFPLARAQNCLIYRYLTALRFSSPPRYRYGPCFQLDQSQGQNWRFWHPVCKA